MKSSFLKPGAGVGLFYSWEKSLKMLLTTSCSFLPLTSYESWKAAWHRYYSKARSHPCSSLSPWMGWQWSDYHPGKGVLTCQGSKKEPLGKARWKGMCTGKKEEERVHETAICHSNWAYIVKIKNQQKKSKSIRSMVNHQNMASLWMKWIIYSAKKKKKCLECPKKMQKFKKYWK